MRKSREVGIEANIDNGTKIIIIDRLSVEICSKYIPGPIVMKLFTDVSYDFS